MRHLEFLQLHRFCFFGVVSFNSTLNRRCDLGDSGFLKQNKKVPKHNKIQISTKVLTVRQNLIVSKRDETVFLTLIYGLMKYLEFFSFQLI